MPQIQAIFMHGGRNVPQIQGIFLPGVHKRAPVFGLTLPRCGMTYRRMNAFKHSLLQVTQNGKVDLLKIIPSREDWG